MTVRPHRFAAAAVLPACAAIALSACTGSGQSSSAEADTAPVSASADSSAGTSATAPVAPSAEELQQKFATITDPSVPAGQKAGMVEGGEQDPAAFDALAQKLAANPDASMTLSEPVTDNGDGTVSVPFTATFDGQQTQGDATFVWDGGRWKLSHGNACAVLGLLSISSPACPEV